VSAVWLLAGLALLGVTGVRTVAAIRPGSATAWVVGAYVVAYAELLVVAIALSLFRAFTVVPLLLSLGAIALASVVVTRGKARIAWPDWRQLARDPVIVVLAIVVLVGLAYTFALSVGVPQVEDDALTFHLQRAALWRQHHGITYLHGLFDFRTNAYPPDGELGFLTSLTLARTDRFAGLPQLFGCLAMVAGTAGIARRIGLDRRQALFGGLLVATLPLIALQAGAAMSDVTVASFLLAAAMFLLDDADAAPWLAGIATALGIATKLSAPPALPVLLALAIVARPRVRRRSRAIAVVAGAVAGAFWYVVNLAETGTWDGHVTENFHVDHGVASIASRFVRLAIEFVDLSGATGGDRWLYAVAAALVLLAGIGFALRRRRGAAVGAAVAAALLTAAPVALPRVAHYLVRAEFKVWLQLGRRDLADLDAGRDITISASNYSWYGPLGSLALIAAAVLAIREVRRRRLDRTTLILLAAPLYWLLAFAVLFFYQVWEGRFFAFPIALAAATWGLLLRHRPVAWAATAIAATTLLLTLVNDEKRPAGLPLLGRDKPRSIWSTPRWIAQGGGRSQLIEAIRYTDQHIPDDANIALAFTGAEPAYPFIGPGLDRRVEYVTPRERDTKHSPWVIRREGVPIALCAQRWHVVKHLPAGWTVLRRVTRAPCRS